MTLSRTERIHTGRIINLDVDTVQMPDGSMARLEMIRHPGAAAVLPFIDDPADPDPRVLLIRQFRHAAGGYIWEIPAGRRDAGEHPDLTAHRELREETGMTCGRLLHLTSLLTTPGFTDEVIHLYMAADLTPGPTAREPDEFMELHERPWSQVLEMVRTGEITDAKTMTTILFVQGFKPKP
jgi:ADP-ribose pyrophosphatase